MFETASFAELLTGGIGSTLTVPTTTSPNGLVHHTHGDDKQDSPFNKAATTTRHQWFSTVTPIDYFNTGHLLVGPSSSRTHQSYSSRFSGQILGHSLPVSPFRGENHSNQLQPISSMFLHLWQKKVLLSSL